MNIMKYRYMGTETKLSFESILNSKLIESELRLKTH